jgi:hypothetical protein
MPEKLKIKLQDFQRRRWWEIDVGGYGSFAFWGSAPETEFMRDHKARWENATASSKPITAKRARELET